MVYTIKNISKYYGSLHVLKDISLSIKKNEIISIIGPSGCGKTTLLNILVGIDKDFQGDLGGLDQLTTSYLFQDLRLLPWKTVYGNMEFVLKGKYPDKELRPIIMEMLEKVGLGGFENYKIQEISGGMQQRLSLARAFAYPSELLIMDEPFKSLDEETREIIMKTFTQLWHQKPKTVIFVTHDKENALSLSNHLYELGQKPTEIISNRRN